MEHSSSTSNLYWLILLYGIQGVPYGFQVAFLPILLHAEGASLTKVSLLRALNLPWMLKLLWVPMVTSSASIKRPLTYSLAGLSIMFALSSLISTQATLALAGVLLWVNVLASVQDIVVDSYAIQTLTDKDLGKGNAVQVVAYKIGAMLGGGVLMWASKFCSWQLLMIFLATIYLIMTVVISLFLPAIKTVSDTDQGERTESMASTAQTHDNCEAQKDFYEGDENGHFSKENAFNSGNHTLLQKAHDRDNADQMIQALHRYNLRSSSRNQRKSTSSNSSSNHRTGPRLRHREPELEEATLPPAYHSETKVHCESKTASCVNKRKQGMPLIVEDFPSVLRVPGTPWLLFYLLTYKIGEQGAISIFPLYLMDIDMTTTNLVLWMGVLAQWVSIAGSLLGGGMLHQNSKQRSLSVELDKLNLLRFITLCVLALMIWFNFSPVVLCFPVCLILLLGGAITTATFTTMMRTSQLASSTALQTLHHTTMATAEVLGKVVFTALAGLIVDQVGYGTGFVTFASLSALPILPLSKLIPVKRS